MGNELNSHIHHLIPYLIMEPPNLHVSHQNGFINQYHFWNLSTLTDMLANPFCARCAFFISPKPAKSRFISFVIIAFFIIDRFCYRFSQLIGLHHFTLSHYGLSHFSAFGKPSFTGHIHCWVLPPAELFRSEYFPRYN